MMQKVSVKNPGDTRFLERIKLQKKNFLPKMNVFQKWWLSKMQEIQILRKRF